jgi:peptidoglycan-associated lipoprotein
MRHEAKFAVLMLAVVGTSACGKKPAPAAPTPQPQQQTMQNGPANDADAAERARRAEEERRRREEAARARATLEEMVFFAYDEANIGQDAASILSAKLTVLRADPSIRIRIEGHADERGSLEYNLALGQRRAQAVKDYLVTFGLDATRFTVDSLGEDRPLDGGHTESAWSRNRRGEFVVTAGPMAGSQ